MTALRIPARTRPWWEDRREIARFAAWLVEEDGAGVSVLLRLIDEPWHFELHRNRMIRDQARGAAA